MSKWRVAAARIRNLFGRKRQERELADEVRFHLEMQVEDNLKAGMNPTEARHAALRSFGGIEPMKETYRERRAIALVETVAHAKSALHYYEQPDAIVDVGGQDISSSS